MKKTFTFLFAALFTAQCLHAQNTFPSNGAAGIGTTAPNVSSLLEIKSTTKGFLPPRMTLAQRNAIVTPAAGLLIYQTNSTPGLYYYSGTAWAAVAPKSANQSLSNLTAPTAISQVLQPNTTGTIDFGSPSFKWKDIYFSGSLVSGAGIILKVTADNTSFGTGALLSNFSNGNTATGFNALLSNTSAERNTGNGFKALYSNTTGSYNAALGSEALYANTTGYFNTASGFYALNKNTTGDRNVAAGSYTMFNNTTGARNTANGVDALLSNTTGSTNTASGFEALHGNTTGFANVAVGVGSLYSNTTPSWIVAVGDSALFHNGAGVVTGDQGVINTATGSHALFHNTTGSYNTANGSASLFSNTTGLVNTALGAFALFGVGTGWQNVGVGYNAGPITDLTNTISVGAYAYATASNSVQLGDNNITSVKAGNNIIIVSDGRFKKNVKENVPGLDFINQLKPITYNYDIHKLNDYIKPVNIGKYVPGEPSELKKSNEDAIANKEKKIYTGFIAQDVEKIADKMGYDFSGVYKPQNAKDPYGLSYADFVVPLVKAVQELSAENDSLKKNSAAQIENLQKQIDDLKTAIALVNPATANNSQTIKLNNAASLAQNIPNPFNNTTSINYTLPLQYSKAKIVVVNNSGKVLREINISGSGKGSVRLDASLLSVGLYSYSLYVNDQLIESKQMVLGGKN